MKSGRIPGFALLPLKSAATALESQNMSEKHIWRPSNCRWIQTKFISMFWLYIIYKSKMSKAITRLNSVCEYHVSSILYHLYTVVLWRILLCASFNILNLPSTYSVRPNCRTSTGLYVPVILQRVSDHVLLRLASRAPSALACFHEIAAKTVRTIWKSGRVQKSKGGSWLLPYGMFFPFSLVPWVKWSTFRINIFKWHTVQETAANQESEHVTSSLILWRLALPSRMR